MKNICFLSFILIILAIGADKALALDDNPLNAGFVSGVWYSQTPFFSGDKIRIYTAVQNRSGFDISGKVRFYDHENLIGSADFSALNGRLIEVWTDWVASSGNHSIYVSITDTKKLEIGKNPEPVTLNSSNSTKNEILVDIDTDSDKIGDINDLDDDNDGVTDTIEIKQGTDPLKKDSDNDGVNDNEDLYPLDPKKQKNTQTQKIDNPVTTNQASEPVGVAQTAYNSVKESVQSAVSTIDRVIEQQKVIVETRRDELKKEIADSGGGGGGLAGIIQQVIPSSILKILTKKADVNKDGRVDLIDFNGLMVNWSRIGEGVSADFNNDNKVDILDFNLLMVHWTG